jgi:hypothetical protein
MHLEGGVFLKCYELQPLDTQRYNERYLVAAFGREGVPKCRGRAPAAAPDRILATVNFRELLFHALG